MIRSFSLFQWNSIPLHLFSPIFGLFCVSSLCDMLLFNVGLFHSLILLHLLTSLCHSFFYFLSRRCRLSCSLSVVLWINSVVLFLFYLPCPIFM